MPRSVIPFLPSGLVRRVALSLEHHKPHSEPPSFCVEFKGSLLFVDLVGFTPLASRLAEAGRGGEETLTEILANYYDLVSTCVEALGGEVFAIAGDGIFALFEEDSALRYSAAARAWYCADQLSKQELAQGPEGVIHARIVAASGVIQKRELGGDLGLFEVVTSDAFDTLASLNSQAEPQRSYCDEATRNEATDIEELNQESDGCLLLPSSSEKTGFTSTRSSQAPATSATLETALHRYLSKTVVNSLKVGSSETLATFRRIAVLFIKLDKSLLSRPNELNGAITELQQICTDLEGCFHQLLMDEKGLCVVLAFGLPPLAHEDDARRAVVAAARARDLLSKRTGLQAGATFGRLFCGAAGRRRSSYAVVGPSINLAARLMQAARPGEVLIDETLQELVRGRVPISARGNLQVKGRAEPLNVFTVGALNETLTEDYAGQPMLARESQQELVDRRFTSLKLQNKGGAVIVRGEAGVGKSHLFFELEKQAALRSLQVFRSSGRDIERAIAYHVWRPILTAMARPNASMTRGEQRALLENAFRGDDTLQSWTPLLEDLLPLGWHDNEVSAQIVGPARADAILSLVTALVVHKVEQRPTVFFLDDAHWFDSRSLALVVGLCHRLPNVLFVLGSRPQGDSAGGDLSPLEALSSTESTVLQRLPQAAVGSLVATSLFGASCSEDALHLVWEHAQGHPLHSIQLSKMLVDQGIFVIKNTRVVLSITPAELSTTPIPIGLEATIASRVDQLTPLAQRTLRLASVVGRSFSKEALAYLLKKTQSEAPDSLDSTLRTLCQRTLIVAREGDFSFEHALTQEVIYESLSFSSRRNLHSLVASWLEFDAPSDPALLDPLLGHHLSRAGDAVRAIPFLERAASRALRGYSNEETISFVSEIKRLAEGLGEEASFSDERRARWEHEMGEASLKLARVDAAQEHFLSALALRGVPVPGSKLVLGIRLIVELGKQLLLRSWPSLLRARKKKQVDRLRLEAAICERLAEVAFFTNDLLAMLFLSFRSLNAAESSRSVPGMLNGYGAIAINFGVSNLHGLASGYQKRAIELAEREGERHLDEAGLSLMLSSIYLVSTAEFLTFDSCLETARSYFHRVGDRFREESCLSLGGYRYLISGDSAKSRHYFERALKTAPPFGAVQVHIWCLGGLIGIQLLSHERDRPLPMANLLENYLEGPERIISGERLLAHGQLSQARLREGRVNDALKHADLALEIMLRTPPVTYLMLWPVVGAGEVFLSLSSMQNDPPKKENLLKKAEKILGVLRAFSLMIPLARPRALWFRARVAQARGARRRSLLLYGRSAKVARAMGLPLEQGRALVGLNQLENDPQRADDYRNAAITIFEQLEASHESRSLTERH